MGKMYEGKWCRVYGNERTKLVLSPKAQVYYGSCSPMTILEHETDGECEYKVIGICATKDWLLGEEAVIRHIEECAEEAYLELAKDYHWSLESWGSDYPPENAEDIISRANEMIDTFAAGGGWFDPCEIQNFSEMLWELYCRTGDLNGSFEDL